MEELKPKIGLEIHTEVKTKSKMFCSCPNKEADTPNIYICPVCTAQPGALPVINKEAVIKTIKLGIALEGKINFKSYFVRKNYFYPDLPKNYQISQYELPLVEGGVVKFFLEDKESFVKLRRIHLEEDAGKMIHFENFSLVDFNRAGAPLIEIVTEPTISSSLEAYEFAKELILILRYLDISLANPEKGQIRFEANISVGYGEKLGTRVEVKNLNSLRALKEAIDYEIERQKKLILSGSFVAQETRGWDENKKETFIQRSKEEAHDYRYFPEPDLVPFDLSNIKIEKEKVPFEIRKEIMENYGLNLKEVDILIWQRWALVFFEDVFKILEKNKENIKIVFNYLTTDIFGLVEKYKENKIKPEDFAKLVNLLKENKISSRIFKDALFRIFEGEILDNILKDKKIDDVDTIRNIIKEVLKENENAVLDFKKGKENAFEFLIGQCMRKTSGKIDPEITRKILKETLTNL